MDPKVIFKPVVEPNVPGAFITDHPRDKLTENSLNRSLLIGINFNEGLIKSSGNVKLEIFNLRWI